MPEREFAYDWDDFESVRKLLYSSAGISMADSKFQLVYSRLARRLRALQQRMHGADEAPVGGEVYLNRFFKAARADRLQGAE